MHGMYAVLMLCAYALLAPLHELCAQSHHPEPHLHMKELPRYLYPDEENKLYIEITLPRSAPAKRFDEAARATLAKLIQRRIHRCPAVAADTQLGVDLGWLVPLNAPAPVFTSGDRLVKRYLVSRDSLQKSIGKALANYRGSDAANLRICLGNLRYIPQTDETGT